MAEIKTWRERLDTDKWPNVAMQSEINELRAALAEREPLTEAEIIKIAQDNWAADPGRDGYILPIKFAHAIEAAHGIKS